MKNNSLIISFLFVFTSVFSQNEPFGFSMHQEEFDRLAAMELLTFDHALLLAEDTKIEEEGGRTNVGRLIPIHQNQSSLGQWTELSNGDKVWQFRFRTADAKGVCVYFDDLFLPEGTSLVLYPASRKYFVGPFGNEDCHDHGHFVVGEITGEDAVLEYYQPATVIAEPRLGIRAIAHMYRYVYDYFTEEGIEATDRDAAACEVDVNCPEGDNWHAERDAVVRLLITEGNMQGLCSGSLVNTTAMDCRKYILTALHCGVTVTDAEWLDCVVRLNYQRAECTTGAIQTSNNRVGVYHLADAADNGGDTGSDFLLLEIQDAIPTSYHPYFAGWDVNTATPTDVVGIHHPSGDRKKISTATDVISGTWQAPGYHWQVKWMPTVTNWGVTEGGSSGSPIFNQNHKIVGHLTGGFSCCTVGGCDPPQFTGPDKPDYYGKIEKDWDNNANAADQKLKVWLDPNNTGITVMDGSYVNAGAALPCDPSLSVRENQLKFDDVAIFPSFADQQIRISSSRYREIKEVKLFNSAGIFIGSYSLSQDSKEVNTAALADGVYYFSFVQNDGNHITKKFIIRH